MGVEFISEHKYQGREAQVAFLLAGRSAMFGGTKHMLNTNSILSPAPHLSVVLTASSSTCPACAAFCVSCVFSFERLNLRPLIQNGTFNLKCLRKFNIFYPCQSNIKVTRKSRLDDCVYLNMSTKSAFKKCSHADSKHGSPSPAPSLWGLWDNAQNIQQIEPSILLGFFNVL